jgi:15-cis-phytoene synthase
LVSTKSSYEAPSRASSLSAAGQIVRRNDPDRFFTALFAPPDKRETLFILYAFNHELARARDVTHEPAIALMRLAWWREVVEGKAKSHEIAVPLQAALNRNPQLASDLSQMIDAREAETDPAIATLSDWFSYLSGTAGTITVAAARLLGAPQPEIVRPLGAAYGAAGVLRSVPFLAAQHRCLLPADILASHGLSPEGAIAAPHSPQVQGAVRHLARAAQPLLRDGRLPPEARAAALVAAFAKRDLHRLPRVTRRGLGDRLAVIRTWLTGRL